MRQQQQQGGGWTQVKGGPIHIPQRYRQETRGTRPPAQLENTRRQSFFRQVLRFGVFLVLVGFVTGGCSGLWVFSRYATGIPLITSLSQYNPELPTFFYAEDDQVVGEVANKRRVLLPIEKLPTKLIYALVAAEDDRFFHHGGVDPLGVLRAVVKNLKTGRLKAGGSTLSQQVAKSFLLESLDLRMQKGLCRNDAQCGWRERCQTKSGSPYGTCVARSFKNCAKKITRIIQGRPMQIYQGFSTTCDAHEACKVQCSDRETNNSGLCPRWICTPVATQPTCQSNATCGFGQRCEEGECKPQFAAQVADILDRLQRAGAVVSKVRGPQEVLQKLEGSLFRERTEKDEQVRIFAERGAQVETRSIQSLPGVLSVYRFAKKSLRRKIREAILATRLERKFTKKEILWLYLNENYFGHHAYGVQAAAQNYFGKNVWDLNLAEIAILAGLPNAPSKFDPYRYPERARQRMKYVLKRMFEMEFITKAEHDEALNLKIETRSIPDRFRVQTPYFTEEVRKDILRRYGKTKLMEGGLRIFTTIDPEKQMIARRALRRALESLDMRQGYRGPLGHIPRAHWADANKQAAGFYGKEPLKAGRLYGGLITGIDRGEQVVTVQIGDHKASLPLAGMAWARKPGSSSNPKNYKRTRIGDLVKRGDWVLVEVVKDRKALKTGNAAIDRKIPEEGVLLRLRQHPKVEGALLSVQPHSGYVDVMVGGYSYARSEFNRAMHACRQPGSSFKPLVYAVAMEEGEPQKVNGREEVTPITPGTILLDTPLVHDSGTDPAAARYKPSNYSGKYEGEVMLRNALIRSMNVPSIRLMLKVGIDKIVDYAQKFGITTQLRKELGLALGQSCVKPWELTQFYASVAREGRKPRSTMLKMVLDREDRVLEDHRYFDDPSLSPESKLNRLEAEIFREEEQILSKETAYLITNLMRQVVAQGTGFKVRKLGKPAAGKTGTTNDAFDVWFTGLTPLHATTVWLGFDKNENPLGVWETGGDTAAPAWAEYMKQATKGIEWDEWTAPPTIRWERVDPKTGKLANVDTPGAIRIPFREGTQPTQVVEKRGRLKTGDVMRGDW
ncbi:transglycosylase domain-containing protein [Myxococcota bacterium]|nr:transglycosylase domain-containing protein [Myxococcota bacterium]